MQLLAQWDSFYAIVGSAAGALIGLQFVVITLIAAVPRIVSPEAGAAYSTPTVIHFGVVLFLSAILRAPWPWPSLLPPAAICAVVGLGGLIYALLTGWRLTRPVTYQPAFEDWLFHFALPLAAYATLAVAAVAGVWDAREALFGIGGVALALLFIGIHNAWDAVTYHVYVILRKAREEKGNQP